MELTKEQKKAIRNEQEQERINKIDLSAQNIYDLKNLLFCAVVDNQKEFEKLVKKEIKKRMSNVSNFIYG